MGIYWQEVETLGHHTNLLEQQQWGWNSAALFNFLPQFRVSRWSYIPLIDITWDLSVLRSCISQCMPRCGLGQVSFSQGADSTSWGLWTYIWKMFCKIYKIFKMTNSRVILSFQARSPALRTLVRLTSWFSWLPQVPAVSLIHPHDPETSIRTSDSWRRAILDAIAPRPFPKKDHSITVAFIHCLHYNGVAENPPGHSVAMDFHSTQSAENREGWKATLRRSRFCGDLFGSRFSPKQAWIDWTPYEFSKRGRGARLLLGPFDIFFTWLAQGRFSWCHFSSMHNIHRYSSAFMVTRVLSLASIQQSF